jgi:hypothetical protein
LHFFSPANVMRLLEIVRGDSTSDDVLATCICIELHLPEWLIQARAHSGRSRTQRYTSVVHTCANPLDDDFSALQLEGYSAAGQDAGGVTQTLGDGGLLLFSDLCSQALRK